MRVNYGVGLSDERIFNYFFCVFTFVDFYVLTFVVISFLFGRMTRLLHIKSHARFEML